ncbi:ribosome small subunit-dependent GTPase A [Fluviibacterium sp. DFM31]|uniref:Small ribosomal subunit biogenesis GTPase RsgA n=1 Tax=Meridianimarinicoccus marinus TaxID=3231483 RepID=A0ABV3L3T8_9RHOB
MAFSLADLGWSNFFLQQDPQDDGDTLYRLAHVHRDRAEGLGCDGPVVLTTAPPLTTAELAVGDWVAADPDFRIRHRFDRKTVLQRRAAGTDARTQLIAANVDTLFIVGSCNADFSPARLERYLALAKGAGCYPVVVLTKADLCDDPGTFRAQAETLAPLLTVLTVDAHAAEDIRQVAGWLGRGQTGALVGSSGVGKTTLLNGLTGQQEDTQAIREDDAKGRHTTTARGLYPVASGGWIIDTPGMRALRLSDASQGIDDVFEDVSSLATQCRFSDCTHETEPGCAILAAIESGDLDPARLRRWQKLRREDQHNSQTLAQARARDKAFGKMVRNVVAGKKSKRGL